MTIESQLQAIQDTLLQIADILKQKENAEHQDNVSYQKQKSVIEHDEPAPVVENQQEDVKDNTPTENTEEDSKELELKDVVQLTLQHINTPGVREKITELLGSYNAKKIRDLDPKHYAEYCELVEKILEG